MIIVEIVLFIFCRLLCQLHSLGSLPPEMECGESSRQVEIKSMENAADAQVSSSLANVRESSENQGKVVLCQGSQLLVSFAGPRGDSSIILLRGNLNGNDNSKEPRKLTINLNPVNNKVAESTSSADGLLKANTSSGAVAVLSHSGEPVSTQSVPRVDNLTNPANSSEGISDSTVSSTIKSEPNSNSGGKDQSSSGQLL